MTIADVVAATGVSENTVIRWEKGRSHTENVELYRLVQFYEWPQGEVARILGLAEVPRLPVSPELQEALEAMLNGDMTPDQAELIRTNLDGQGGHEV